MKMGRLTQPLLEWSHVRETQLVKRMWRGLGVNLKVRVTLICRMSQKRGLKLEWNKDPYSLFLGQRYTNADFACFSHSDSTNETCGSVTVASACTNSTGLRWTGINMNVLRAIWVADWKLRPLVVRINCASYVRCRNKQHETEWHAWRQQKNKIDGLFEWQKCGSRLSLCPDCSGHTVLSNITQISQAMITQMRQYGVQASPRTRDTKTEI